MSVGAIDHPARQPVPPAAISRVLLSFSRAQLEGFVAVAIDLMDLADGDSDLENGNDLEDDFTLSHIAVAYTDHGPGCPISDHDAAAWVEWHTMRGSQKRGPNILAGHEDDEDDDPAEEDDDSGQCTEDEISTALSFVLYTVGASGPGCPLSDPGGGNVEDEGEREEGD